MDKCKIVCLIISVFVVVNDYTLKSEAHRFFIINGMPTVLASINEVVELECSIDTPLEYCRFVHENNKTYTDVEVNDNKCTLTIFAAGANAGMWKCYLGGKGNGEEIVKETRLRIVHGLAATERNVTTFQELPVTLLCVTSDIMTLSECRFKPPIGKPFSISSDDNTNKLLLGRYYFPRGKSLKNGECAVNITRAKSTDSGTWTCSAVFGNGREYTDSIIVIVNDPTMGRTTNTMETIFLIILSVSVAMIVFGLSSRRRRARYVNIRMNVLEERPLRDNGRIVIEPKSSCDDLEEA